MTTPPSADLGHLLNALADGIIDDAEEQALAAWLKRDAAARQHYREFMGLHAALHWDYLHSAVRTEPSADAALTVATNTPSLALTRRRWLLAAAAVFLAAFVGVKWLPVRSPQPVANVAVLARAVAAEWEGVALIPGRGLAPGWLRLKTGVVQVEFARGARVMLEGPVEFRVVSDNEGFLRCGKLRAHVPEAAHGFTIRAEGFAVVDHGTDFGCIVPAAGAAEVHVLVGSVEVQPAGTAATLLAKAEAVRLSTGKLEAIPAQPGLFISDEEFRRLEAGDASGRLAASRQAGTALSAHPAALVHYDFEQARGAARTLPNLAHGPDMAASIVGCEPALGRWAGKGALEFRSPDDRLRFNVLGELQALTLLAWVRVDGLPNVQSSLLMGESEQPGEVHWYLHRNGSVGFAVIGPDGQWRSFHSPAVLRPELFGRWVFVVTTFDSATGTATHYINGQPVASQRLEAGGPLRLRTVEIGNWGVRPGAPLRASKRVAAEPGGYVRNLQGRVDEFALLSAALPAEEIRRLFAAGRPSAD